MLEWLRYSGASIAVTVNPLHWSWVPQAGRAFTDDEGGIQGYFGMLPVAFCPTCYSCMSDMIQQDLEMEKEIND